MGRLRPAIAEIDSGVMRETLRRGGTARWRGPCWMDATDLWTVAPHITGRNAEAKSDDAHEVVAGDRRDDDRWHAGGGS